MKKYIFRSVIILLFVISGFAPSALAQTSVDTNAIQTLQEQVAELLIQIKSLQTQIVEMTKQQGELRSELSEIKQTLRLQLREGMSNEEVQFLQEMLADDPEIYPEGLITGYFGPLTKKAVRKFQKKYNIEQVGEVGPKTRAKMNALFANTAGKSLKTPKGLSKKFNKKTDTVFSTSNEDDYTTATSNDHSAGKVILCHKGKKIISVGISSTVAHLNHGDMFGLCGNDDEDEDDEDDESDEDEDDDDGDNDEDDDDEDNGDTVAPIISGLGAFDTVITSTNIVWTTDEDSNSAVWYSISTPVVMMTSTPSIQDSNLVSSHSIELPALNANTMYYYIVTSIDSSGNTATSDEFSFSTLDDSVAEDTTPPAIATSISATSISATTATISWETDEESDSIVYYDTVSAFTISSTTPFVSNTTMTMTHNITLSALTASTTYYYIVTSTDGSGNTATSSEPSFTTLSE